jgi:hemoglobin
MPRFATIDEPAIQTLVHRFYDRVRTDAVLAGVFEAAIADGAWPAHLARMCRFWSSVMLTTGAYSGNPVATHRAVEGIAPELFPHWLALFTATASDLFEPEPAARFTEKAGRIAASLQVAVFHRALARPNTAELSRPLTAPAS